MKKTEPEISTGALMGGLLGVGALVIFLVLRRRETPLDQFGKLISNVGEILESHHVEEPAPVKAFEKKLHHNEDAVAAIMDWIATGISLWKELKK